MDREEAVSAALQLQHDARLMMTNLQVLGQFVAVRGLLPGLRQIDYVFPKGGCCVISGTFNSDLC